MTDNVIKVKRKRKRKDLLVAPSTKVTAYIALSLGGLIMLYPLIFQFFGAMANAEEYKKAFFLALPSEPFKQLGRNLGWFFKFSGIWGAILLTFIKVGYGAVVGIGGSMLAGFCFQKYDF